MALIGAWADFKPKASGLPARIVITERLEGGAEEPASLRAIGRRKTPVLSEGLRRSNPGEHMSPTALDRHVASLLAMTSATGAPIAKGPDKIRRTKGSEIQWRCLRNPTSTAPLRRR